MPFFLSLSTNNRQGGGKLAKPNYQFQKRQKELAKKKKKEEKEEKRQRKLDKKTSE